MEQISDDRWVTSVPENDRKCGFICCVSISSTGSLLVVCSEISVFKPLSRRVMRTIKIGGGLKD